MNVTEARSILQARIDAGTHCPVCDQYAKMYARLVNASMARDLIGLYRTTIRTGETFHHVRDWRVDGHGGGQHALMRFWDLMEEKPKDEESDTRTSGFWRITSTGVAFVERRVQIARYAFMYNQELHSLSSPRCCWITDALGKKFSYSDLMSWHKPDAPEGFLFG